jgi:hypothetical protein
MESTLSAFSTVKATAMARSSGGPSLPLLTISKALNRFYWRSSSISSLVVVWESVTFESLRLSCSDKLIVIYFDTLRSFFSGAGDPIPYLFCLGSRSEPSSKEDDFVSRFGI